MNRNPLIDQYITKQSQPIQSILIQVRDLIQNTVPDATEHLKWNRPVYALDKNFCYLQANKKHVNLGFMHPGTIDDSQGLLEGSGQTMQHIKISNWDQIDPTILVAYIRQSANPNSE